MAQALALAQRAARAGEVPVGAVVVCDNGIIGRGYNRPRASCDPTAHAEIIALRTAARYQGNYRLNNATLYVTIEPCTMCAGAVQYARIKRLVYGAPAPRTGAVNSVLCTLQPGLFNHNVTVTAGVAAPACAALLQDFFSAKRQQ